MENINLAADLALKAKSRFNLQLALKPVKYLALLLGFISLVSFGYLRFQAAKVSSLEAAISKINEQNDVNGQAAQTRSQELDALSEVLKELARLKVVDVRLKSLEFNQGSLDLLLEAKSMDKALGSAKLLKNHLNHLGELREVELIPSEYGIILLKLSNAASKQGKQDKDDDD